MATGIGPTLSGYVKELSESCRKSCGEGLSHYMPTMGDAVTFIKDRLIFPQKDTVSKAISGLIVSGALIGANQVGLIAGTSTVMMISSLTLGIYIGNKKGLEFDVQKARDVLRSEVEVRAKLSSEMLESKMVMQLEKANQREKFILEKIETIDLLIGAVQSKVESFQNENKALTEEIVEMLDYIGSMLDGVKDMLDELQTGEE